MRYSEIKKTGNSNSSISDPLFQKEYASDKTMEGPKAGRASEYIVPFLLKVLDLKENRQTLSISKCIVELDNVAIQIDSVIDSSEFKINRNLEINKFNNLSKRITDCFSYLKDIDNIEPLISSTMKHVNSSFEFNTTSRHQIYSFEDGFVSKGCTTFYLLPLIEYLVSIHSKSVNIKKTFILLANYIQLLDDFIDVFNDIKSNIRTPVTERFLKIKNDPSTLQSSVFNILVMDVKRKLSVCVNEIEDEVRHIQGLDFDCELMDVWHIFHEHLGGIALPETDSISMQKKYLQKVYNIIPPILCYT